jgi:hypothetical protein
LVEPARVLAEQPPRRGRHAHQLAAHRHQVEVGLQHLVLAPGGLDLTRRHQLRQLARRAAAAGGSRVAAVDQPRQLHRDRRRALRAARARHVVDRATRQPGPVDAAMLGKALVLARDHRGAQGWRELVQPEPRQPARGGVDAHGLQRGAVAVEEELVGRAVGLLDLGEGGQRQGRTCHTHHHPQAQRAPRIRPNR